MWTGKVLLKNEIMFVFYFVFLSNDFDSFGATEMIWFHDEDVLVAAKFSFLFPSFESLGEDVGDRTYIKFSVLSAHLTDVSP